MSTVRSILESIETKLKLASDKGFVNEVEKAGSRMITALKLGKKILIAGNGGSAAEAQHFAAELAGQFIHQRKGLPVIALTTNPSITTAIGNDFGYEHIFSRQIEALGKKGDILIVFSTSGKSKNIIEAMYQAKLRGIDVIDMPRIKGTTQEIQENQLHLTHEICKQVKKYFK